MVGQVPVQSNATSSMLERAMKRVLINTLNPCDVAGSMRRTTRHAAQHAAHDTKGGTHLRHILLSANHDITRVGRQTSLVN